jgi:K+ transporter
MQLLLGGLITLAVTAIVQILVIPWVQVRNRRRERWERDVIELHTLLEQEMSVTAVEARALTIFLTRQHDDEQTLRRSEDEALSALETLQSQHTRLWLLAKRVKLISPRSVAWKLLSQDVAELSGELGTVTETAFATNRFSEDQWRAAWDGLDRVLDRTRHTFSYVGERVKPPPANRLSLWIFAKRTAAETGIRR